MKWEYQNSGVYKGKGNPNYRGGKEVPCAQCGKLVYRRPSDLKKRKNIFCSNECHDEFRRIPKDPNRLRAKDMKGPKHPRWTGPKYCKICGKELFERRKRQVLICSEKCKKESKRRGVLKHSGENHPDWKGGKIKKNCKVCSKQFEVIPSRKDEAFYCSVKCYRIGRRNRVTLKCKQCGKQFIASYIRATYQNAQFCSTRCYLSYKGQTSLEVKVATALHDLGINFIDQYRPKGTRQIFDFYLPDFNLFIEADGNFWHYSEWAKENGQVERDKKKNRWAKRKGFNLIRLKESDVNEIGALNLLKKELEPFII